ISVREVQTRTMNAGFGATGNSWTLSHPDAYDAQQAFHGWTDIHDAGAGTDKVYWPGGVSFGASLVVPSAYEEWNADGTVKLHKDYNWLADGWNNAFLSSVATT